MRYLIIVLLAIIGVVASMAIAHAQINTEPHSSTACFDNAGIQIESQDAWACEHKDADEGGTLYFWVDNETWMYSLNPDSGNVAVWGTFDRFNNNFTAAIQETPECIVNGAGYGRHPTTCNGRTMTPKEQASYDDFAEYMGEVIPDKAW